MSCECLVKQPEAASYQQVTSLASESLVSGIPLLLVRTPGQRLEMEK